MTSYEASGGVSDAEVCFATVFSAKVRHNVLRRFAETAEKAGVDLFLFMYFVHRTRYRSVSVLDYRVQCPEFDSFEYSEFIQMLNQEVLAKATQDIDIVLFDVRAFNISMKECILQGDKYSRGLSKVGRYLLLEILEEMKEASSYLEKNPSVELYLRTHPSARAVYIQVVLEEGLLGN